MAPHRTRRRSAILVFAAALMVVLAACNPVATYLLGNNRTGYVGASAINPANASRVAPAWTFRAGPVSGQAIVADKKVYWGDWTGVEHAATTDGTPVWTANLGSTSSCFGTIGITSTPTLADVDDRRTLYVGGGDAVFYALDANTGQKVWSTRLGPSPDTFIWSSPAFFQGSLYIGVASYGDCPLVQGRLVQLDASTGAILHTFKAVPDGCTGGGIVASPTIDEETGTLYITTGNTDFKCAEPYTSAMVRLKASDLSVIDHWGITDSTFLDADWEATPTIFTATVNGAVRKLVGSANKDGTFYAFDRQNVAAGPVWKTKLAIQGEDPLSGQGSIAPAAFDGTTLYAAGGNTTIGTTACKGSVQALDPATGAPKWQACLPAPVLGAVSAAPGIVMAAAGNTVWFLNAATGAVAGSYTNPTLRDFYGPVTITGEGAYVGNMNGDLLALRPTA